MRIQFLLSIGQYRLSKEEATELLDQRVHMLTSTQELHHSAQNFVRFAGDYLVEGSHVCIMMALWLRHIDRFGRQYDKAFYRNPQFGADLMDRIHKRVQVFLHSCNTTAIEDVESGALEEFRSLQKRVERGEWLASMPALVDRPAPWEEGRRKSEGTGNGARNHGVDPQLCISENLGIITKFARQENLRLPIGANGTEICLHYISKEECDRSCTRSHAPL